MNNQKSTPLDPALRVSLIGWFRREGRDLPWRRTQDPYAILVSEIMLQQTQVATVIAYFERWMERFPTIAALAAAPEADVLHAWQGLGYYSRARNLHGAARLLVERTGGEFPAELEQIRALPGVGRYTAGAVSTFAFDARTPIVDANIARVVARIFDLRAPIDSAAGLEAIWSHAASLLPTQGGGRAFNSALMELGALLCTPRRPDCARCPIDRFCQSPEPELLPIKKPRQITVAAASTCAFILSRGRLLLEQEQGRRWHGLWRLPEVTAPPLDKSPLLRLTYPITRYRVELSIYGGTAPRPLKASQRWFDLAEIERVAIPSPHRRALRQLLPA